MVIIASITAHHLGAKRSHAAQGIIRVVLQRVVRN